MLLTIVVWSNGPRVDTSFEPPVLDKSQLPTNAADLNDYLQDIENRSGDVWPHARKEIIWFGEVGAKSTYSVIYFHGFTAIRTEISPVCERVAEQLNANLYFHRFPGHGKTPEALAQVNAQDWIQSGLEGLRIGKMIGEKVIVITCSNGGTIASVLACYEKSPEMEGLILISPNIAPADPRAQMILDPWGIQLAEWVAGKTQSWGETPDSPQKHWTSPYPTRAIGPVMAMVRILEMSDHSQFTEPTLVFFNPSDAIVNAGKTVKFFNSIPSHPRRLVEVLNDSDPSHHVITGDLLSPNTVDSVVYEAVAFIRDLE